MSGSCYRILAFDPASTQMGVAVLDYDITTQTATVLHAETIKGPSLLKHYKELTPHFAKSFCIQTAYYHLVKEHYLKEWKPDYTVVEGAFYHKLAQTLISLTLVINSIRMAVRDAFNRDIQMVAPMETKKVIANNHIAKKDEIREGILNNPHIKWDPAVANYEFTTEHDYDAIGHGYTFCYLKLPAFLGLPIPDIKKKKK